MAIRPERFLVDRMGLCCACPVSNVGQDAQIPGRIALLHHEVQATILSGSSHFGPLYHMHDAHVHMKRKKNRKDMINMS